jgi:hypothetical protein
MPRCKHILATLGKEVVSATNLAEDYEKLTLQKIYYLEYSNHLNFTRIHKL